MRRLLSGGVALSVLVAIAIAGPAPQATAFEIPAGARLRIDLARVQAATARYHFVELAIADGYISTVECVSSPAGGMGIHFIKPALAGDPGVDVRQPELLLYEPTRSGRLRLVGVEYFKADADQNLATDGDRPSLFGRPFDGPMLGHSPGMPIHYDLHVWIWKHNPSGMFAEFNPRVSCSP